MKADGLWVDMGLFFSNSMCHGISLIMGNRDMDVL